MFGNKTPELQTPEEIQKTLKRKSIINWVIFIIILALISIGVLELINFATQ